MATDSSHTPWRMACRIRQSTTCWKHATVSTGSRLTAEEYVDSIRGARWALTQHRKTLLEAPTAARGEPGCSLLTEWKVSREQITSTSYTRIGQGRSGPGPMAVCFGLRRMPVRWYFAASRLGCRRAPTTCW